MLPKRDIQGRRTVLKTIYLVHSMEGDNASIVLARTRKKAMDSIIGPICNYFLKFVTFALKY
jgi:hypothetical protein